MIIFAILALGLIALEGWWLSRREDYDWAECGRNLAVAFGNAVVGGVVGLAIVPFMAWVSGVSPWAWPETALTFIVSFFAYDYLYYWYHRANHRLLVLWAGHEMHHSSEVMNLSVSVRNSWSNMLFSWVFWTPLYAAGFPLRWILLQQGINIAYQFFIHSARPWHLGPLEKIFNSPTHHRVHHGQNAAYINKNYGGILILWDRLHGTFASSEEAPVFGVVHAPRSRALRHLLTSVWADLGRALCDRSRTRRSRLALPFRPPEGV